jgi:hypothetical protein
LKADYDYYAAAKSPTGYANESTPSSLFPPVPRDADPLLAIGIIFSGELLRFADVLLLVTDDPQLLILPSTIRSPSPRARFEPY